MATLGQPLTAPETGWQRFDDNYGAIDYSSSNLTAFSGGGYYQSTIHYSAVNSAWGNVSGTVNLKFYGSQIRLIGGSLGTFGSHTVTIDGVTESVYKLPSSTSTGQYLFYSKTGLSMGVHNVTINIMNDGQFGLDAIDVDLAGKILYSNEQSDVSKMKIGDRIVAEYVSRTSGVLGSFKNLGTSSATPIPAGSAGNPNGSFYFYYVGRDFRGRKILIADRNIQSGMSWNILNNAGIATGSGIQITFSSIPTMTSNNAPYGTVSASSFNAGNDPYKAFDGFDDSSGWATSTGVLTGWIAYNFGSAKKISQYKIKNQNNGTTGVSRAPKNWTFEGSNDGTNWTVLDTRSNETSWINSNWKTFNVTSPSSFSQYRINVSSNNGDPSYLCIGEIEMSESPTNYNYATMRLPTGGNASDAYGEWDTYIVNSTLNGTIAAGDNSVWNWSGVYSWTSSTTFGNTYRVNRGSNTVSTFNYSTTDAATALGFRPVLLVTEYTTKYLFQDGVNIKTYDVTNGWTTVGQAPATETMFLTKGMNDLSLIGNTAIQQLSSPTLLFYTQSTNATSATMTTTGVPKINFKYKVTTDNPNQSLLKDYATSYSNQTVNDSVMVSSSFFVTANPYTITVTALQEDGTTYTSSGTVQLVETQPSITASMSTGNTLNLTIGDSESDQVQYAVKLNGTQIYPLGGGLTTLSPSPVSYTRTFKSNEILVGSVNTIHIDAFDQYGLSQSAELPFVGTYSGLLFTDSSGGFYSDDLGNILKYDDFGTLIAGQASAVQQVFIKNLNNFAVKNVKVWVENVSSLDAQVVICDSNNPFVPLSNINYQNPLNYGDQTSFYIQILTSKDATPSSQATFIIDVQGDPT